ncbi:VENN motif pre-toxin domain-containing protein, partial [Hafnia psychrotolerans]|uniref:VENN motif pre-toxin domain-containing protein n=1 Tax=Hafnia psychrotolerans TaxID=1477018 RepID=UPI0027E54943
KVSDGFDQGKIADRLELQREAVALSVQTMGAVQSRLKADKENEIVAKLSAQGLTSEQIAASPEYKQMQQDYGIGGKYWTAGVSFTSALSGLLGGNLQGAAAGAAAPYLANLVKQISAGDEPLRIMLHTALGAFLASAQGGDATAGAAGALTSAGTAKLLVKMFYPQVKEGELTEAQKQVIDNLMVIAGSTAGGLASGSLSGVGSGANTAKNEVENNTLSSKDEKLRQDAKWSLPYLEGDKKVQAEKLVTDLNAKDKAFDAAIDAACKNLSSADCRGMRQELAAMGKSYDAQLDGQYIGTMASVYKEGADKVDSLLWQYATADAQAQKAKDIQTIATNWGVSLDTASTLYTSMAGVHTAAAIGGAIYGMKGVKEPTTVKPAGNASSFDANDIRFSQNTVSYNKTDRGTGVKYTYNDLVSSMKKDGWKGDPVDVIKMPDGKMTSMDNTRISAAREAGIKVEANVRSFDDPLPKDMMDSGRFGSAKTWGEAITGRINNQSSSFSKNNPNGSSDSPRITGKGK